MPSKTALKTKVLVLNQFVSMQQQLDWQPQPESKSNHLCPSCPVLGPINNVPLTGVLLGGHPSPSPSPWITFRFSSPDFGQTINATAALMIYVCPPPRRLAIDWEMGRVSWKWLSQLLELCIRELVRQFVLRRNQEIIGSEKAMITRTIIITLLG